MEGSRKEVMRFMLQVIAEFQIPDERTQAPKMQDWAANLAWGGADELAASGMMNNMRREGGRAAELNTESGAHVSRHATSVARMNDGAAGGSARRQNDDSSRRRARDRPVATPLATGHSAGWRRTDCSTTENETVDAAASSSRVPS